MYPAPFSALSVYKTKAFARFAKRARISDAHLWKAAEFANRGSVDADLGGGVLKLRLARPGEGKSGGFRTILVLRSEDIAVYLYGYEKKDRANIDSRELQVLRRLAEAILGYNETQIAKRVEDGDFIKIPKPEEENAQKIPH